MNKIQSFTTGFHHFVPHFQQVPSGPFVSHFSTATASVRVLTLSHFVFWGVLHRLHIGIMYTASDTPHTLTWPPPMAVSLQPLIRHFFGQSRPDSLTQYCFHVLKPRGTQACVPCIFLTWLASLSSKLAIVLLYKNKEYLCLVFRKHFVSISISIWTEIQFVRKSCIIFAWDRSPKLKTCNTAGLILVSQ